MGRLANGWIPTYLEYTAQQESPQIYHFWTAVSMIAAALRRNVVYDRVDYQIFPNLYVMMVGDSATGKSTALKCGYRMLLQCPSVHTFHGRLTVDSLFDEISTTVKVPAAGLQQENALMLFADEARTMLGRRDRAQGLVDVLTALYGGEDVPWHDRSAKGRRDLGKYVVNFLGASTAAWVGEVFKSSMFEAGVTGRWLFVVNTSQMRQNATDPETYREQHRTLENLLLTDLRWISSIRGRFTVEPEALGLWNEWRKALRRPRDTRLHAYHGRRHDFVLKLAMILSVSDGDGLAIDLRHMQQAIRTLEMIEPPMKRAFEFVGDSDLVIGRRILHLLETSREPVSYYQVKRYIGESMDVRQLHLQRLLDDLERDGTIKANGAGTHRLLSIGRASALKLLEGRMRAPTEADAAEE